MLFLVQSEGLVNVFDGCEEFAAPELVGRTHGKEVGLFVVAQQDVQGFEHAFFPSVLPV
jgi:hypothetical protein